MSQQVVNTVSNAPGGVLYMGEIQKQLAGVVLYCAAATLVLVESS
jgi:hypothetical protein